MEMHRLTPRISAERARTLLVSRVRPLSRTEKVPLLKAHGRSAAGTLRSPIGIPPFPSSHVDGYAVRSVDLPAPDGDARPGLSLVGEVHAGESFPRRLRPGETVAVATGAPVPEGADAVEMFEDVEREGTTVRFSGPVPRGQFIDPPGHDLRRGAVILRKGEVLSAPLLGALGIAGIPEVRVFARPRIALLSNGNELREPGTRLPRGAVYESNTTALAALVERCGGEAVRKPSLPDDATAIARGIAAALRESDLVVITGGSSVGERDLLGQVFPRFGPLLFHGIRVRPGMPTLAAVAGGKVVLGMPGHPASCLSNALWLLAPLVRKLASLPGDGTEPVEVTMADATPLHGHGFSTLLPLRIEGGKARSTFHGSHFITSLKEANGFALLPPSKEGLKKGERLLARKAAFLGGN